MDQNDREEFDLFADEFLVEKAPRTIVIMGSSKIEDILFTIIGGYLLPKISKKNDQDELLEGDRPLATFSSRIKLAYRLGLIDLSLYSILEKIRSIRNSSAHSIEFDINKSPLRDQINILIQELKKRESFTLTTERYFSGLILDRTNEIKGAYLTICVLLEAIKAKVKPASPNSTLISISRK